MAYIQKNTPPPNVVYPFSLRDFSGGLNNASDQLADNESSDLLNMMFTDTTLMEKRYGTKRYGGFDGFTIPDYSAINSILEYKPYNDVPVLVRATSNALYIEDVMITDLAGTPSMINHEGCLFIADGTTIYVYGRFAQTTTTYEKVIGTPIDDYVLLEIVSPTDGHAMLDATHNQGVLNIDYTNFQVFYEPCTNEFNDTYKGANKVPAASTIIVSHNNRLFVSGVEDDDDNVFISDVQNPYYFPVSLPMQMPPNFDNVIGMNVYNNSVIVGRRNDLFAIEGETNNPDLGFDVFRLVKINSHTGFISRNCSSVVNNYLFFFGYDGKAYALGNSYNSNITMATTCISKKIDVFKSPINLSTDHLDKCCTVFYQDEWYVSFGSDDVMLVYNYTNKAWTFYNNLDATSFYIAGFELMWGTLYGYTFTFDRTVFLDDSRNPYNYHWYSKYFDMNDANTFKYFRDFFLILHTYDDFPSDVTVKFEIDYQDVVDRIVLTNQISIWGKAKWGDRFISHNIADSLPFIIGRRGRTIRFKVQSSFPIVGKVATYSALAYSDYRIEGNVVLVEDELKYYCYIDGVWTLMTKTDLNQRMKVYQINGDYELRGKR